MSKLWSRRNLGAPRGRRNRRRNLLSPRTVEIRREAEKGLGTRKSNNGSSKVIYIHGRILEFLL
jgi:hypothetical protein